MKQECYIVVSDPVEEMRLCCLLARELVQINPPIGILHRQIDVNCMLIKSFIPLVARALELGGSLTWRNFILMLNI